MHSSVKPKRPIWLPRRGLNKINDDCQTLLEKKSRWRKMKGFFSTDEVKGQIVELKSQIHDVQMQFLVSPTALRIELLIHHE